MPLKVHPILGIIVFVCVLLFVSMIVSENRLYNPWNDLLMFYIQPDKTGLKVKKTFFMLNSTEHKISTSHEN